MKQFNSLLFILSVIVPFIVNGQCKQEYKKMSNGSYFGCLNDSGTPHGEGTYTWTNGDKYVGPWENGKRHGQKGTMTQTQGTTTSIYTGPWKNNNKHGQGTMTNTFSNQTQIKKGEFKSDILWSGTYIVTFDSGETKTYQYTNGEESEDYRSNLKNYYDKEDILGPESKTIKLNRIDYKYYVDLKFNGIPSKDHCIFDTGAFGIRIGKRLYDRLKSEGVKVRDLKMQAKTFGVGGTSTGDWVLFEAIEIGGYTIKNVIAHVHTDNDFTLIGIDFFDKFGNVEWNRNQSSLTLTRDK